MMAVDNRLPNLTRHDLFTDPFNLLRGGAPGSRRYSSHVMHLR